MKKRADEGKSRPEAGSRFIGTKVGRVPKPAGDYLAGATEHEMNQGKPHTTKVASAPVVHNRIHTSPSSGTDHFSKSKPALQGHNFGVHSRGRDYKYETVKNAVPVEGAAAKARKVQLGSNQHLAN
jgi:hypothetical protein